MSGIAGIFNVDERAVEFSSLKAMTTLMHHRGLDGISHYQDKHIGLGQCNLHTTPEAMGACLPYECPKSRAVIIMDGWLSNFLPLRDKLLRKGVQARLHCDAELISNAYQLWGSDCFEQIDGEFAVVIWDKDRKRLICGRDATSKKPFYYHFEGGRFSFASELNALLCLPWVPQRINEGFICERLIDECLTLDETPWQNILRLPQGHVMRVSQSGLSMSQYWSPDLTQEIRYKDAREYTEHYKEILYRSVAQYSRSIGPLSCEVSGGLDSSAVFAVARDMRSRLSTPEDVLGFTLDFAECAEADETDYVDAISKFMDVNIHKIPPTRPPLEEVEAFMKQHKIFTPGPTGFMHSGLYQAVSNAGGRVLLTGFGGDEWLSGRANGYAEYIQLRDWYGLSSYLSGEVKHQGLGKVLPSLFRHGLLPLMPNAVKQFIRSTQANLTKGNLPASDVLADAMNELLEARRQQHLPKQIYHPRQKGQLNTWVNPHIRLANESMEHLASLYGIELRSPLDSRQMIEFSIATAEGRRRNMGVSRVIHRAAIEGLLPRDVIDRDDKADFSVMYDRYLPELKKNMSWQADLLNKSWAHKGLAAYLTSSADRYMPWFLYEGSVFCNI